MGLLLSHALGRALRVQGLLPAKCRNVEILSPASGVMVLRYEVGLEVDDLLKVADAFTQAALEAQEARDRARRPLPDGTTPEVGNED